MKILWKYTWVKIYVLFTILAVMKQLYSFSVLVDFFEYKKAAYYLFENWITENASIDRFLEPLRRTILFPFIWKIAMYQWHIILVFQLIIGLSVPFAIKRLVDYFKFHHYIFPLTMCCLSTYPLQYFYTGFIMPDLWSQILLLWIVVFYLEERYQFVPILLALLILLKPVFIVFLIFPFVLAIFKKYTISILDFMPILIVIGCCLFNLY